MDQDATYMVELEDVSIFELKFTNSNSYTLKDTLYFDMWGQPLAGDTSQSIPLASLTESKISLTANGRLLSISITPQTGEVTLP